MGFLRRVNVTTESDFPAGDPIIRLEFGSNSDFAGDGNATFVLDTRDPNRNSTGYKIYSSEWFPKPQLIRSDADTILIFLSANGIEYRQPEDDPIFAAHDGANDVLRNTSPMNDAQYGTVKRIAESVRRSTLGWIITSRQERSLWASTTVSGIEQTYRLPPNQWQYEVLFWATTTFAYIQRSIFQYAANHDPDWNFLVRPADGSWDKDMCSIQLRQLPSEYTSFSFLGIAIIIVVGSILIVTGWSVDWIMAHIWPLVHPERYSQRGEICATAWNLDNKFQLQRLAFEGKSRGDWKAPDSRIPRTRTLFPTPTTVCEIASKALTVANALRSLGNTIRGVKPNLLQQAVSTCVLHKAYYVILAGARALLPVFRTTPISVLYREFRFSPPEIELDQIALLASVRLQRLDPYHPLRRRAEQIARDGRQTSQFTRRVLALPNSEQINPLQHAPWYPRESRESAQARIGASMGRTKEQAAADFSVFQNTIPSSDIIIFLDGSRLENGHAGGNYVCFQAHHQFLHSTLSYGLGKEVFDAEAEAALASAQAAIAYPTAQFATNLWICLDNLEVTTRLLSPSKGSSQEVFESFCTLAAAWPLRKRLTHTKTDLVAKEGAASIPLSPHKSSYVSLKRYAKPQSLSAAQTWWQSVALQTYQDLKITTSPKRPGELQLN
ncbi:conserved hypothetical protein [Talaromyces stipitatus ATCC 10500]|uniref:RNase H type-1 domain-containing protein n=1 Tax=Talaromyces stipitatus (strain ATCC 10500 / CBS 375.48 / QM 6759 / NRRL 1006) TaxID=441959 RepID=B8MSX5_TALSN|nr:uncharacterized protein TSTA_001610 [Talaromyces stipitatus ATCC 10500]EED12090.1 conserved hypothetical protein [Talaromyces stipitatus ATCC 10500]